MPYVGSTSCILLVLSCLVGIQFAISQERVCSYAVAKEQMRRTYVIYTRLSSYSCYFISTCYRRYYYQQPVYRSYTVYYIENKCCEGYMGNAEQCSPICTECTECAESHLCLAPYTCVCPTDWSGNDCTDYMAEIPGPAVDEDEWSDDEFEGYVDNTDGEPQCFESTDVGKECDMGEIPEYSLSPGINHQCSDAVTPLEIYKMLLTDDILDQIVKQTILYADQYITSHPVLPHSRVHGWSRETFTREELQKFISLITVMGLVNLPTLEDHWVTTWPYSSQTCSKVLKRDRFTLILKFLHLNNNAHYIPKGQSGHDPLYKLRPLLDPLIGNFQAAYTLNREVSVDEAMVGFKGRLSFLQYLPRKPTKWGMKAFVLADSSNGYVYNWKLYTGKDKSLPLGEQSYPHAVVLDLLKGLERRGHHVYVDNYYTSPALFSDLRDRGFGACGTVRANKRGLPIEMKATLERGAVISAYVDRSMMALKWMDKRPVLMLTTIHNNSMTTKVRRKRHREGEREEIRKPVAVDQYNQFMGGVDRSDQLLSYYGFTHRTVKWWRRAAFHLFDMAIVNSYVLYSSVHSSRKLTHEQFRIELAKELLLQASVKVADDMPACHGRLQRPLPPQARLTERHFPSHLPSTPSGRRGQKECVVCSKKRGHGRKTTSFMCNQCQHPMCIIPCFELYHTKVDPVRYLPIQ